MIEHPMAQPCPSCELLQDPILVIRSSGVPNRGWVLRCRSCEREWPHQWSGRPQAS